VQRRLKGRPIRKVYLAVKHQAVFAECPTSPVRGDAQRARAGRAGSPSRCFST
jgi:hypothetical protein